MKVVLIYLATATVMMLVCGCSYEKQELKNIEIVHALQAEIWNAGKVDLVNEFFAPEFVGHFPGGTVHGPAQMGKRVEAHRMAFPDWNEEVAETIVDKDRVVLRYTSRGTNLGEFLGNPPTGNRVEISEVCIFRLVDGKVVEQWVFPDMRSMLMQLRGENTN